jgi:hypothetical protein
MHIQIFPIFACDVALGRLYDQSPGRGKPRNYRGHKLPELLLYERPTVTWIAKQLRTRTAHSTRRQLLSLAATRHSSFRPTVLFLSGWKKPVKLLYRKQGRICPVSADVYFF